MRHEPFSTAIAGPVSETVNSRFAQAERAAPPRHDARTLTAGGSQAEISLDGVRYLLRITRQGKLILTK